MHEFMVESLFHWTIFGILISIVTILILQRKAFRTPTNLILQHVAFFDAIVLISFNIYSFYFYLLHQPNPFVGQSKFWPCFAIFHTNIGIAAHSIALWLTCLLANCKNHSIEKENFYRNILFRFVIQLYQNTKQVTVNSTHLIILIWIVAGGICALGIPNYLSWSVTLQPAHIYLHQYNENSTEKVYWPSAATGGTIGKNFIFYLGNRF